MKLLRRLTCALVGHRWHVLASSYRTLLLAHLSPVAGCCCECMRCGKRQCDVPEGSRTESGMPHNCARDRRLAALHN